MDGDVKAEAEVCVEVASRGNVIDLDAYRPHVVLSSSEFDGAVHVLPVELLERWVRDAPDTVPPTPEMVRAFIRDWLEDRWSE